MKTLERSWARGRGALRRLAGRASISPARTGPAKLVLELGRADDHDPQRPGRLRGAVVDAVAWLGPLPVQLVCAPGGPHRALIELVRVAHRLECETQLVTDGTGVDETLALELIQVGLGAVRVLVGGVSDPVHRSAVGNPALEATRAVQHLLRARSQLSAPLDVEVGLPWRGRANEEARAVAGWGRQLGADGFRVIPAQRCVDIPDDPQVLAWLQALPRPYHRTPPGVLAALGPMAAIRDGEPGVPGTVAADAGLPGQCSVASQRVAIGPDGAVAACPYKPPLAQAPAALQETWAAGAPHFEGIASCPRVCLLPDLLPAGVRNTLAAWTRGGDRRALPQP